MMFRANSRAKVMEERKPKRCQQGPGAPEEPEG